MNFRSMNPFRCAAVAAVILAASPPHAQAITVNTDLVDIRQAPDFASSVVLGHLVTGRTSMLWMVVGGTYRVSCPSSYTGVIEGYNWRPQMSGSPNVLTVEVPAGYLPAERVLPGFDNVPAGTTLQCSYTWSGAGRESAYQLSAYGLGMSIGGGMTSQGDIRVFEMYKPGRGTELDGSSCIH